MQIKTLLCKTLKNYGVNGNITEIESASSNRLFNIYVNAEFSDRSHNQIISLEELTCEEIKKIHEVFEHIIFEIENHTSSSVILEND